MVGCTSVGDVRVLIAQRIHHRAVRDDCLHTHVQVADDAAVQVHDDGTGDSHVGGLGTDRVGTSVDGIVATELEKPPSGCCRCCCQWWCTGTVQARTGFAGFAAGTAWFGPYAVGCYG